jgi:hypothetical protein
MSSCLNHEKTLRIHSLQAVDCALHPQRRAGLLFLEENMLLPSALSFPHSPPSLRKKCINKGQSRQGLFERECCLLAVSFLHVIKIGQFDNALCPVHIVRYNALQTYMA